MSNNNTRRFDDFRKPATPKPVDNIDRDLEAVFCTAAGKRVLDWLWQSHVVSQCPMMISECAWREAEGKKRLVLDLVKRIEEISGDNSKSGQSR